MIRNVFFTFVSNKAHLSWDVVAILLGFSGALNLLLSISVVLSGLDPSAVKLDSVGAGDIIDGLLLHIAVGCLNIDTLVVILGGGVNLVGGVTDPVLSSEALLNLVGLL